MHTMNMMLRIMRFERWIKSGPPTHICSGCGDHFTPLKDGGCDHCGYSAYAIPIERTPREHRYGEKLICYSGEFNPETLMPLHNPAPASAWKPPEERSASDSCRWPRR